MKLKQTWLNVYLSRAKGKKERNKNQPKVIPGMLRDMQSIDDYLQVPPQRCNDRLA
jgi:hypothetical protein